MPGFISFAGSLPRILAVILLAGAIPKSALRAQTPGRSTRIVLSDSVSAAVHLGGSDTSVMVFTPVGVFRLRADSSALASWAKASARLPAPVAPANATPGAALTLSAAILRATDQSGNAMRFVRVSGDSLSSYQLAVANGAWEFAERISPEPTRRLFIALEGKEVAGSDTVNWVADKPIANVPAANYQPAEPVPGTQHPKYPAHADFLRAEGEVMAQFAIDTTGRARPESLLIIRATHPLFSISVRDALPAMRFVPAKRNGKKVEALAVQTFKFKIPY